MIELVLLFAFYYFIRSLQAALKDLQPKEEEKMHLPPPRETYEDDNVFDINQARRRRR